MTEILTALNFASVIRLLAAVDADCCTTMRHLRDQYQGPESQNTEYYRLLL